MTVQPRLIGDIFSTLQKLDSVDERIRLLKSAMTPSLQKIIEAAYHPMVRWDLPEGVPMYRTAPKDFGSTTLLREARSFYMFLETTSGKPNGSKVQLKYKREKLFVRLLEALPQTEAEILLACKERNLNKWKLSQHIAHLLFPQGIPDGPDFGESEVISLRPNAIPSIEEMDRISKQIEKEEGVDKIDLPLEEGRKPKRAYKKRDGKKNSGEKRKYVRKAKLPESNQV